MLGALIRRKKAARSLVGDEYAAESTNFSLSTAVPRPSDRRTVERLQAILPLAKLVSEHGQDLCRIKNISAGGVMAETTTPHPVGRQVFVEMSFDHRIPGQIVWARDGAVGIKFDANVDLRELLSQKRPRSGSYLPRPPRLEVTCGATVKIEALYHQVEVRDISLGGIKVALHDWDCLGKEAIVTVESLRPIRGRVRWYRSGQAGIVWDEPLSFEELAEWMGKRVELASLRTGAWERR